MPSGVSFNVDAKSLINAVFDSADRLNDLGVVVENGTEYDLTVTYRFDHGNLASTSGTNPIPSLPAPAAGTNSVTPNTFVVGAEAQQLGSAIFLYIASGQHTWGIYARTPPKDENWFQYTYSNQGRGLHDTYNQVQNLDQHLANDGPQTWSPNNTAPNTQVTIRMTQSPGRRGELTIQFLPS